MKALVLVLALLILVTPAAFASEAELSEIERPVDAAAQSADEDMFARQTVTEEVPALLEVYRHEEI